MFSSKIKVKSTKLFSILAFSFVSFIMVNAQQDCFYYHDYFCKFPNSSYFYSGQSRSTQFRNGMTSEFKLVTFGGEDYHISICFDRNFKNVRMRLLEDNAEKTVLYDNADFGYKETMTFTNNVSRKLIIEMSVPKDPADKEFKESQELYCVGVLIHFRKTYQEIQNKVGF
jgi:hypothetical protein